MEKLCILIPTKGHPDNIRRYIERTKDVLRQKNITLVIGESQDPQSSKEIVEEYQRQGYDNIEYRLFESSIESEQKVQKLCQLYYGSFEYVWICRDGLVPKFEKFYDEFEKRMNEKYGIISIMPYDRSVKKGFYKTQQYNNQVDYFHHLYWHLTFWGTYIIDSSIASAFSQAPKIYNGTDNSFFMLESVFRCIAEKSDFRAYNIVGDVYEDITTQKSTWRHKNHLLPIWGKAWSESIDRLPSIYDKEKPYVKLSNDINLNYFAVVKLFNFRAEGDFSFNYVKKYKKYIKEVARTPLFFFYIIVLLPKSPIKLLKDLIMRQL